MFDLQASLNEALFNEVSLNKISSSDNDVVELSAFYQCLNCSCVNVWTWHCCMCYMSMYKILKLCQIAKNIDINDMSVFKQFCEICIQNKSYKHVSKIF